MADLSGRHDAEPGSSWQDGYAESFHSRLREELLSMEEFDSARYARAATWREDLQRRVRASLC